MALPQAPVLMVGAAALLAGNVLVPTILLWLGHGYRTRPPAVRRLFWGGATGYAVSLAVLLAFLLTPPVYWGAGSSLRWLGIHWSSLILPVLSAVGAWLRAPGRGSLDGSA